MSLRNLLNQAIALFLPELSEAGEMSDTLGETEIDVMPEIIEGVGSCISAQEQG